MTNATCLAVTHPAGQYEVVVGYDLIPDVRRLSGVSGPLAVITDSNVGPLHAAKISDADCLITVPAGEENKTLATVQGIYDRLLEAGIDRKGTVLALGGGVVGDIAGFAAATYLRGINLVQCPTTVLSMVDASVGGKTGVDLAQGKNLVGAFKQPVAVVADLDVLRTLPEIEFNSGLAEVVKHGLISAPAMLDTLKGSAWFQMSQAPVPSAALQSLVTQAIQVKRDVVQEDPYEMGRRALLNLGHTFAHAVETVSRYEVRHGEAVAMGLVAAANLSARLGHCPPELQRTIEDVLAHLGLPSRIPPNLESRALLAAMGTDKKKALGRLRFVLLRGIGDAFVTADVDVSDVLATLAACS